MRKQILFGALTALCTSTLAAAPGMAQDRDALEATILVQEAAKVVAEMKTDADAVAALQRAKGIYVIPNFAQAAIVVGGWGGDGVMLAAHGNGISSPAFYDVSALSAGAQVGFTEGAVVMLLMSDEAVNAFRAGGSFSLEASAEFAIADFTGEGTLSTDNDIVVWTDVDGLFAGLTASAADIDWDEDANNSYYGMEVTASMVIDGQVTDSAPDPLSQSLTN